MAITGRPVTRIRGFSLVELLAVLAIMSILATMAAPLAQLVAKREKEQELRMALRQIRDAIDQYKRHSDEGRIKRAIGESGYPRTLDELVEGVADQTRADGARIVLLRRIPADPWAAQAQEGPRSWGLRSYASAWDAPREGADVYDVYSKSTEIGLNGVPYRQW